MTFLPIVARELRVAARRRGIYWIRLIVATIAICTGGVIFLLEVGVPPAAVGHAIFLGLSILALTYCFFSGRLATADCLSEEKREGTLGLLFLTDLKGYDVVLGKLVATSVSSFYGLLAVMPVLAVPLLLGGSSNAEFWRVIVVLLTTFMFSLAVGMFGSALSRDMRRAMAANFALMLLLAFILPAVVAIAMGLLFTNSSTGEVIAPCPIYSFCYSLDVLYKTKWGPAHFWWSVGIVHALTWLLLGLASVIVPRTWQDKAVAPNRTRRITWRGFWRALSYGRLARQAPHRKRLLDINAFYWLSARARLKPLHVWIFLTVMTGWWVLGWLDSVGIVWYDPMITLTLAAIVNSTIKAWVAIEAGQQLAEDQSGGALELLLSTPLTLRDILHGQFLALRRQFLKPVLFIIAVELGFMYAELRYGATSGFSAGFLRALWLTVLFMFVADLFTLRIVALRIALTAKNLNRATIATMSRILFLPWVLFAIGAGMANLWAALFATNGYFPGWMTYLGLWFIAGLATNLFFGLRAWNDLLNNFRQLGNRQFDPVPSRAERRLARRTQHTALPPSATERRTPVLPGDTSSVRTNPELYAPPPMTERPYPQPSSVITLAAPTGAETRMTSVITAEPTAVEPVRPPRSAKKRLMLASIFLAAIIALPACFYHWTKPKFPPPVIVSMTQSNGPLRVFDASGILLALPDDSLWRWGPGAAQMLFGQPPLPRATVPVQVGTKSDWLQITSLGDHSVGLRRDGTIWECGWMAGARPRQFQPDPQQIGSDHDWASVSAGGNHSVALKKDGTLWAWGDNSRSQLGNGPGSGSTNVIQVGTNTDWIAANCQGPFTMAVRKDGTLWAWGQIFAGSPSVARLYPTPTQVCRDTNWIGLTSGLGFQIWARNQLGELRQPLAAFPDAEAGAAGTCPLIASNTLPGHVIWAYSGSPKLYDLRADGTLWEKSYSPLGWRLAASPVDDWHRFGKRSDWVGIWSASGTAIGLTADGTIWMWGVDPSREPTRDFSARLALLQIRLKEMFGNPPPRGPIGVRVPAFQKEPRPLMRLVFPAATNTARGTK